jgi:predicted DNA-binding transcriptional regulator AlpA
MVQKTFRARAVCDKFGFSRSTLYQQIKDRRFPPPNARVGLRAVGWTEDLLDQEQARRGIPFRSDGRTA